MYSFLLSILLCSYSFFTFISVLFYFVCSIVFLLFLFLFFILFFFFFFFFFFSSRRRHTRCGRDWSSDVCSSDLIIQLIDYYPQDAMLICATNHPEIIDTALLRRFQLRINFDLPNQETLDAYYEKLLSNFPTEMQGVVRKYGISFAEAKDYIQTSVKSILIEQLEKKASLQEQVLDSK